MKVRLRIEKDGAVLYDQGLDAFDAESFGRACSQAWITLRERRMAYATSTSIGALIEHIDDQLLEVLDGARLRLTKA